MGTKYLGQNGRHNGNQPSALFLHRSCGSAVKYQIAIILKYIEMKLDIPSFLYLCMISSRFDPGIQIAIFFQSGTRLDKTDLDPVIGECDTMHVVV